MKIIYLFVSLFLLLTVHAVNSYSPDNRNKLKIAIKNETTPFVNDLETLVNTDSGSENFPDLQNIQQLIEHKLKSIGMSVTTTKVSDSPANIIFGTMEGSGSQNIMLLIHYDTVFQSGDTKKNPFKIIKNHAYGPGVADAKGGILLTIYTAKILKDLAINNYRKLTLAFNPDEELGSPGSHAILAEIAKKQDYVLIYEPPKGDSVTVGTRGSARLELTTKGRSAHSGVNPEQGRNPAVELINQMHYLQHLGNDEKDTSVNWTIVISGNKLNVIPAEAKAMADVRVADTD